MYKVNRCTLAYLIFFSTVYTMYLIGVWHRFGLEEMTSLSIWELSAWTVSGAILKVLSSSHKMLFTYRVFYLCRSSIIQRTEAACNILFRTLTNQGLHSLVVYIRHDAKPLYIEGKIGSDHCEDPKREERHWENIIKKMTWEERGCSSVGTLRYLYLKLRSS